MIKIEAVTLEDAFNDAATSLKCSVTELAIEVVQVPSSGFMGFFKKNAIIVATVKKDVPVEIESEMLNATEVVESNSASVEKEEEKISTHNILNDTIMPASFVSDQDEQDEDLASGLEYTADYDDEYDESVDESEALLSSNQNIDAIALEVKSQINELFRHICFEIEHIEVRGYDKETILIEFKGEDAALLIGKEGYRYKALSYMLFNWINSKYDVQLRLEIAEFLKNQEESVSRYLEGVYESIDRDGRAQTKILDGVLVQIALKELRERYPQKYVVIRSTKDGLKYIIVNDYHNN
ncbi:Jag N-terminal domain-containing protein [Sulfurimonas sp.]|uniref:Jag N-terminal domain-containing protein n=1 Tax=Sulfurimonas sp. TaxID=2022749 RepID=UPI00260D81FA|nr:Jag N-terminal domain-containing protein [Sulfurimonas sp.]